MHMQGTHMLAISTKTAMHINTVQQIDMETLMNLLYCVKAFPTLSKLFLNDLVTGLLLCLHGLSKCLL